MTNKKYNIIKIFYLLLILLYIVVLVRKTCVDEINFVVVWLLNVLTMIVGMRDIVKKLNEHKILKNTIKKPLNTKEENKQLLELGYSFQHDKNSRKFLREILIIVSQVVISVIILIGILLIKASTSNERSEIILENAYNMTVNFQTTICINYLLVSFALESMIGLIKNDIYIKLKENYMSDNN